MTNNSNPTHYHYITQYFIFLILSLGISTAIRAASTERNPIAAYLADAESGSQEAADRIMQCMMKNKGVNFDSSVFRTLMDYEKTAGSSLDAQRCFIIGLCYSEGAGVACNETTAQEWFTTAAEMGSPGAQFQLAGYLAKGSFALSPSIDPSYRPDKEAVTKSRSLIARLMEQGLAAKYFNLGSLSKISKKTKKTLSQQAPNLIWQSLAAETGNVKACVLMINLFTSHLKLRDQIGKAIHYATLLTDTTIKGKGLILRKIDIASRKTDLTDENLKEMVHLYQTWSNQGDEEAKYLMGLCHEEGRGVEQDYTKAASYYLEAAEKNVKDAQMRLAICYAQGLGVEKDPKLAKKWRSKSTNEHGLLYEITNGVLAVGQVIIAVPVTIGALLFSNNNGAEVLGDIIY